MGRYRPSSRLPGGECGAANVGAALSISSFRAIAFDNLTERERELLSMSMLQACNSKRNYDEIVKAVVDFVLLS